MNLVVLESLTFSELQEDRKIKKFTDVKVKVGNIEMDAHRRVLEEASPVIKTMFEPRWFNGNVLEFNEENVDTKFSINLWEQHRYYEFINSHILFGKYMNIFPLLQKAFEEFLEEHKK